MYDPVPGKTHAALRAGLTQAFGTAVLDGRPVPMSGGMSGARLYRIRVGGIAYLLRLEPPPMPPFVDPRRSQACMRAAAELCLAPRVWHADPDGGVVIMDLIAEQPKAGYPGGRQAVLTELAQTVRLLHQGPRFPPVVDYLAGMDLLIAGFRAAGLGSVAFDELVARFEAFRRGYRTPQGDLVASHNDLNSRNVLYDGRRLWLIDWDAAFLADRYVDLAGIANWFGGGPGEDAALLATYFGRPPEPAQLARLTAMRQVNYLFYGVMFGLSAAEVRQAADLTTARPLAEMRQALEAGRLDLFQAPNRLAYSASLLRAALEGFRALQPAQAEPA